MSVINTNITSMIGQSNLSKSQNALQTSMERLSSGLRINSAKDDAAGQAIANRMTAQITGLNQASRNANDGISVAQTAEGALNQINDNVQRIRELSVQAANGTNSQADLQSIQDEVDQRLAEINRISEETDFNGVKVLSEDTESLKIQVGANDNEVISVNLETINAETLGLDTFRVAADQQATLDQLVDDFGAQQQTRASYAGTDGIATGALAIEVDSDGNAVTTADAAVYLMDDGGFTVTEARATVATADIADTTNGNAAAGWTAQGTYAGTESDAQYTATLSDGRVVTATVDLDGGTIVGYQIDGNNFSGDLFSVDGSGFTVVKDRNQATEADLENSALERTDATYQIDTTTYRVNIDGEVRNDNDVAVYASVDANGDPALVLEGEQRAATGDALKTLDDALNQIDSLRSELGAVQNRFEDAINNLDTNSTNLSAARSRIEDADYAVEVADMTRAQILQQAGTSVLAQANQIPQNVLSLLG